MKLYHSSIAIKGYIEGKEFLGQRRSGVDDNAKYYVFNKHKYFISIKNGHFLKLKVFRRHKYLPSTVFLDKILLYVVNKISKPGFIKLIF